jgi:MFS family permease
MPIDHNDSCEASIPSKSRTACQTSATLGKMSRTDSNASAGLGWYPVIFVFLPFALGYFLSYLFRTINALLAAPLTAEFRLDASHLGLMTSVYFLTFAAIQLPLGALMDRYGPRRVQSGILLVAAAGAAVFGAANRFEMLVIGRGLIGLGVACSLVGGLKAIVMWFPKERVSLANGCFVMLGTLGAVFATAPTQWLLGYFGWRDLLELLAGVTALTALVIFLIVPELSQPFRPMPGLPDGRLRDVFGDRRFWRLAPLSTMCISTAWAVQGLWAAPWLADVDRFDRSYVLTHLFVMGLSLSVAALLFGIFADHMRRRGVGPQTILPGVALLFICNEVALIFDAHRLSFALWAAFAGMGGATVLSSSIIADYFPTEITARANAALTMFHIGGAFVLQEMIGWLVDRWPSHAGHYPSIAYKTTLAIVLVPQMAALLWFASAGRKLPTGELGVLRLLYSRR